MKNEMTINFIMFCTLMLYWVWNNMNSFCIQCKIIGLSLLNPNICCRILSTSAQQSTCSCVIVHCFALELDLVTIGYFLLFHDIRGPLLAPIYTCITFLYMHICMCLFIHTCINKWHVKILCKWGHFFHMKIFTPRKVWNDYTPSWLRRRWYNYTVFLLQVAYQIPSPFIFFNSFGPQIF